MPRSVTAALPPARGDNAQGTVCRCEFNTWGTAIRLALSLVVVQAGLLLIIAIVTGVIGLAVGGRSPRRSPVRA